MIEQPFSGRATLDFNGRSLKISIPSRKNAFIILFFCVWLVGWFFGEKSALTEILRSENIAANGFLLFWLIGWTIGGLFALAILLWTAFGEEIITFDDRILQVGKGFFNFSFRTKKYETKHLKNLVLNPSSGGDINSLFSQKKIGDFWGITGGKISFDYGMKTIKFGIGIDEAEARHIISEIKRLNLYKEEV